MVRLGTRAGLGRRWLAVLVALVLGTGFAWLPRAGVAAAPSTPAGSARGCHARHGTLVDDVLQSSIGGRVPVRVYLPPCYGAFSRAYPYLILLHGSPGLATDWTAILGLDGVLDAGIETGALAPMVVIMPEGGTPEERGVVAPGASFESEVLDELIPTVEARYCVQPRAASRAIGGLSRGGWWALEIAFRHPDMFAAVGGHSAYLYEGSAPAAYDPYILAETAALPPDGTLRLWLDAGESDYAGPGLVPLLQTLRERGVSFTFEAWPGLHDRPYWRAHVGEYLAFYGAAWPSDATELPACSG